MDDIIIAVLIGALVGYFYFEINSLNQKLDTLIKLQQQEAGPYDDYGLEPPTFDGEFKILEESSDNLVIEV